MKQQTKSTRDIYSQEAVLSKLPDIKAEGSKFVDLGFVQGAMSGTAEPNTSDWAGAFMDAVDAGVKIYTESPDFQTKLQLDKSRGILKATDDLNDQQLWFMENRTPEADQSAIWAQKMVLKADENNEAGNSIAFNDAYLQTFTSGAAGAVNQAAESVQYDFMKVQAQAAENIWSNKSIRNKEGELTGKTQELWNSYNGLFNSKQATIATANILNQTIVQALATYPQARQDHTNRITRSIAVITTEMKTVSKANNGVIPETFWSPITEMLGSTAYNPDDSTNFKIRQLAKVRQLQQNHQDPSIALSDIKADIHSLRILDDTGKITLRFIDAFSPELDQLRSSIADMSYKVSVDLHTDKIAKIASQTNRGVPYASIVNKEVREELLNRDTVFIDNVIKRLRQGENVSEQDLQWIDNQITVNSKELQPLLDRSAVQLDNQMGDAMMDDSLTGKVMNDALMLQEHLYTQLAPYGALHGFFLPEVDTPRGVARILWQSGVTVNTIASTATTVIKYMKVPNKDRGTLAGEKPYNDTRIHLRNNPDFMSMTSVQQEKLVEVATALRLGSNLTQKQIVPRLFERRRSLTKAPYPGTSGTQFKSAKIPPAWGEAHFLAHGHNNKGLATTALINILHSKDVTSSLNKGLNLKIGPNTKLDPREWDMKFIARRKGGYTLRISPLEDDSVFDSLVDYFTSSPSQDINYIDVNGITQKRFINEMTLAEDTIFNYIGGQ